MRNLTLQFLLVSVLLGADKTVLERMAVFGNTVTPDEIILRELEFKTGDPLSDSLLIRERSWLIRSDFLKKIDFQVKPGMDEHRRNLLIVVQEKGHWSFLPSFHTNDLFGIYGGGTLKYSNLFGRRQDFRLKAETGGKKQFRFTCSNPWIPGTPKLFYEADILGSDLPYLYKDVQQHFKWTSLGLEGRAGKRFGRRFLAGVHGGIEIVESDLAGPTGSGRLRERLETAGIFTQVDTRDWPAYPRQGFLLEATYDRTRTDGLYAYQTVQMCFRGYIPNKTSDIIAFQVQMQSYFGEIPIYKRIHLGGGDTVRGIPTGDVAGDRSIMANIEYRFPIMYERDFEDNLHVGYAGVVFADAGTAWFSDEPWTESVRAAAGFGVHAIWDDYVIRGEYGFRGRGWGFINIGTSLHF